MSSKITVNKNSPLYTIRYLSNNKTELYNLGNVSEQELENIYTGIDPQTNNHNYDDNHTFIELKGALFIINNIDILKQ